jgi:hypothetical protein
MEKILPSNSDEPTEDKKVNEAILSVWDVDANGWRSFRMNTVTRVRQIMAHGGGNA